ncbi:GNAT family N-acetyltransferase [Chelativorans intermedius]|uniref:GNAT family N-acetyltransferase n=1 Tax=Chelativorans intermedius TaxID=515947 RepID=A0ABV6DBB1_9HYPH|nr:GNAT family N-acetyltransferase [Chelativorans intermedius]MCT9000253.1 GNAT family N-acetyltransferase [Chelativorans intermedius]
MVWRARGDEAKNTNPDFRKSRMEHRVKSGETVGLLAYQEGEPIGWCSVAPRTTYRDLGGPHDYEDDPNAVWSLTCFSVAKEHRKKGLSSALLEAAIGYARDNGAKVIEAYPVAPNSPSYQYMGLVPQFERRGFTYIQDAGSRRRVHRLEL